MHVNSNEHFSRYIFIFLHHTVFLKFELFQRIVRPRIMYIYVLLVLVVLAIFTLASLLIGLEKDNPQFLLTDILRGKKKEIFSNIFIWSWREKKDNDCDVRVEVQGSQCSFTTYADQYLCYSSLLGKSVPKVQLLCNKFN